MSRRQIQIVAILLAAVSLGELALNVLALGHRHGPADPHGNPHGNADRHVGHTHALATSSGCSHHHHCGETSLPPNDVVETDGPASHQGSSDDCCAICRYLAQPVLAVSWTLEVLDQQLIAEVVCLDSFDVAAPSHLFPQPRSPPATV